MTEAVSPVPQTKAPEMPSHSQLVAAILLVNADAKACRDKRPGVEAADEAYREINRLLDEIEGR